MKTSQPWQLTLPHFRFAGKSFFSSFKKAVQKKYNRCAGFLVCLVLLSAVVPAQVNLNLGLVAYYPFSGNANDATANGNNPIANSATLTADRLGNPNSAYSFNGANSMQIPNSVSLNSMTNQNQISLCAWVRPSAFYGGSCMNNMILMKGNNDNVTGKYSLRFADILNGCNLGNGTTQEIFYGDMSYSGTVTTGPFVALNNWYSVVYTSDGTIGKIYVNCQLIDSTAITSTIGNTTDDLFLGKLNNSTYPFWFTGIMDEVRIYNRALNQAEVNVYGACGCPANSASTVTKCSNQSVTLNGGTGTTYAWSPGTALSSTTIQSPVCTATTNTTYTVTVFNAADNCTRIDTVRVVVNQAPVSNIRDTSVCMGDSVRLTATGGGTYSWSPNYNISAVNIANPQVWPAVTTTYSVTITGTNGCSTTDQVLVTVNDCHCEDSCNWSLTGNSNVLNRNFIGSINNADFKMRTNNIQRMVVKANGNVGIGLLNPAKLLEVNGEASVKNLPPAAPNDNIVLANASGDLKSLAPSGDVNQYLSGNGTWQNVPAGGGTVSAGQGLTLDGNTVLLGDRCQLGGGKFEFDREVNMFNKNLYFNSDRIGKIFMGNTNVKGADGCRLLQTRLEIGTQGLEDATNDYVTPNPSTSGLRFTDLTAISTPVTNRSGGVLSLDEDGDVIWVNACCSGFEKNGQLNSILERLDKLEKELKSVKDQNALLKDQLTQMDVLLTNNNTIVLNQNVPNPFAESTVVTYTIPKAFRQAQIIFTGMSGEVIKTAEIKQSGKGQVNVFAKDITSGLYTYTLVVDGKTVDTKKMIKY
jgi:hypothetical protein